MGADAELAEVISVCVCGFLQRGRKGHPPTPLKKKENKNSTQKSKMKWLGPLLKIIIKKIHSLAHQTAATYGWVGAERAEGARAARVNSGRRPLEGDPISPPQP